MPGAQRVGLGCVGHRAGTPAPEWAPGSGLSGVRVGVVIVRQVGSGEVAAACWQRRRVCRPHRRPQTADRRPRTAGEPAPHRPAVGPMAGGAHDGPAGLAGVWAVGQCLCGVALVGGATLFRLPGLPPAPHPLLPTPSKRPDDAPSHAASGVQRRGHSAAAMLGLPCSRPTWPRWARRAAAPHRATRAGPALPLPLGAPGSAEPALSPPALPTRVPLSRRYPATGTRHPAPSDANVSPGRPSRASERRPRQTTQPTPGA